MSIEKRERITAKFVYIAGLYSLIIGVVNLIHVIFGKEPVGVLEGYDCFIISFIIMSICNKTFSE